MYINANDFIIIETSTEVISSTMHSVADDDDSAQYVFVPLIVFLLMLLLSAIVYCMSKYRRAFSNFNGKSTHQMIDKPICDDSSNEGSPIRKLKMFGQNYKSFENE